MPTVLRIDGYRLYFYSHEPNEPPHVHVDKAEATGKVWLERVGFARQRGFRSKERNAILSIVEAPRHATPAQRSNWTKAGGGFGIHWPDVDEDLSVAGLLGGTPAPEPRRRAAS